MSENTSTNLMDTAPGGENSQSILQSQLIIMQSINTALGTSQSTPTISLTQRKRGHSVVRTQLPLCLLLAFLCERWIDSTGSEASEQAQQEKSKGEHKAENTRYGKVISEHGFGGETIDYSGDALQHNGAGETTLVREKQGYREVEGSGIGA
jgi:hypothetical protein